MSRELAGRGGKLRAIDFPDPGPYDEVTEALEAFRKSTEADDVALLLRGDRSVAA